MARRKKSILSPVGFEGGAKIMKTILVKSYKIGKATAKVADRRITKSRKEASKNNVAQGNSKGCMLFFSVVIFVFCLYFLMR